MVHAILYLVIGLVAGLFTGLFGIGGGSLRIPLLNLAGLPLITAFGINLVVVPFSSLVGAIYHRRNIDWKLLRPVLTGGTAGAIAGALLTGLLPVLALAGLFFVLSLLTVTGMYLDRLWPRLARRATSSARVVIPATFVLNFLTGLRGGSGGSLLPPLLKVVTGNIRPAIATSLAATIFTAAAAAAVYWQRGDIQWLAAVATLVGSMAGSRWGSKMSIKTKPRWLEAGLSVTVVLFAAATVLKALY